MSIMKFSSDNQSVTRPRREPRWGLLLILIAAIPILVVGFSSTPPASHTGGFEEPTCVVCHGTAVNEGNGGVTIDVSNVSGGYTSDSTFPVTITVNDPNGVRWGFELSARTQSGQQAGTLIAGSDGFTQILSQGGIQYIAQTGWGGLPSRGAKSVPLDGCLTLRILLSFASLSALNLFGSSLLRLRPDVG